jgi:hypothetical protein
MAQFTSQPKIILASHFFSEKMVRNHTCGTALRQPIPQKTVSLT